MAQQDGPQDNILFAMFDGLKNTVGAERLKPTELSVAKNVDLDDMGQVRRRRGYDRVLTGDTHSLWSGPGYTLGVVDGTLCVIRPNFSTVPLHVVGNRPLAYVEVAGTTYFCSEITSGKVLPDLTVQPWGLQVSPSTWLSPVVRPTETLGEVAGKLLGAPPHATALCESGGRIYLAHDTVLWATELFMFDYVDKTRNFLQFESKITALGSVGGGFYVGTEDACYFLSGTFTQMSRSTVTPHGVVPGSMVKVPAESVRPEQSNSKEAVIFMTNAGVHLGLDAGVCYNMTDTSMHFPQATNAGALFRRQDGVNQYIIAADHGGTPTSTARIGDYIDAEIRRFQGA